MKRTLSILASLSFVFGSVAAARSCKDYLTCREAVIAWCKGEHPRADGDKDGIPCENVCKTREQVDKIKQEIGCK